MPRSETESAGRMPFTSRATIRPPLTKARNEPSGLIKTSPKIAPVSAPSQVARMRPWAPFTTMFTFQLPAVPVQVPSHWPAVAGVATATATARKRERTSMKCLQYSQASRRLWLRGDACRATRGKISARTSPYPCGPTGRTPTRCRHPARSRIAEGNTLLHAVTSLPSLRRGAPRACRHALRRTPCPPR